MAQIFPSSIIRLYKNIPLNISYEHSIYFSSVEEQTSYFGNSNRIYETLQPHSYQRVSIGVIRINKPYKDVYDVNYMSFLNSGNNSTAQSTNPYLTKWFYAFVLQAKYINDEVTQLVYAVDVIQTWLPYINLLPCYIERQHTATDNIGDNLMPEPIRAGDYVYHEVKKSDIQAVVTQWGDGFTDFYDEKAIYVLSPYKPVYYQIDPAPGWEIDIEPAGGRIVNGMYSGLYVAKFVFDPNYGTGGITPEEQVNAFLKKLTDTLKGDEVIAIYTAPASFDVEVVGNRDIMQVVDKDYNWVFHPATGGSARQPHNNKLYTAPYSFLHALTPDGDTMDYCYEYFSNFLYPDTSPTIYPVCAFKLSGVVSGAPEMQFVPFHYKTIDDYNMNERIVMGNYPMNSWTIDSFRAWLAQNKARLLVQAYSDITDTVYQGGMVVSNVMDRNITDLRNISQGKADYLDGQRRYFGTYQSFNKQDAQNLLYTKFGPMELGFTDKDLLEAFRISSNSLENTLRVLADIYVASSKGSLAKGSQSTSIDISRNEKYVHLYHTHVNDYYATIIDQFFDRYGYAIKQLTTPNLCTRQYWTYIKTADAHVEPKTDLNGNVIQGISQTDREIIETILNRGITFWNGVQVLAGVVVGDYTVNNGYNPILSATQGGD